MKKYTPSAKNNAELKDEVVREINSYLNKIEKGKYNKELSEETVKNAVRDIKAELNSLENALGSGKENLQSAAENSTRSFDNFKKASMDGFENRLQTATENLCIALSTFKDVVAGDIDYDGEEDEQRKKSWQIQRLEAKIEEIRSIREEMSQHEKRLEGEIRQLEKDVEELENKMLDSDNERVLNDLYRRISSTKGKINSVNVRRSTYSSCYSIMDLIESNAKEIVVAGEYSPEEFGLARAILNMDKIRASVGNPDAAVPILKMMEKNIEKISERIKECDQKIFTIATPQDAINDDAMKYKEELLKKRRAKENLEHVASELDGAATKQDENVIDNKGE